MANSGGAQKKTIGAHIQLYAIPNSVQYYHEYYYKWLDYWAPEINNADSGGTWTAVPEPSPQSIDPEKTYYLWRKDELWVLNDGGTDYVLSNVTYTCTTGESGVGLEIKGDVYAVGNSTSEFSAYAPYQNDQWGLVINNPIPFKYSNGSWVTTNETAAISDAYILQNEKYNTGTMATSKYGHAFVWTGDIWKDVGLINIDSQYIHMAWCNKLGTGIDWTGQGTDFVISKNPDTVYRYVGFLITTDKEDPGVNRAGEYKWDECSGDGITSITNTYGVSSGGTTESENTEPNDINSWVSAPQSVTNEKPYLWQKTVTQFKYSPTTTKYHMIGAKGQNGIDAIDAEWAFVRTTNYVAPTITDEGGTGYTRDDYLPLARVSSGSISGQTQAGANTDVRCTDDPMGVTRDWPYEWQVKREKGAPTYGSRTWNKYTGTMTLYSNYAENSVRIDLDNEADMVSLDSNGKVRFNRNIVIKVRIYDGATVAKTGVSVAMVASALTIGDVTPTVSGIDSNGVCTITYEFEKGDTAEACRRTIALTYRNTTYTAEFSLGTTDADEIWQVMPTPSEVSFSLNSSTNTLTPSSQTLKCGYVKYTGSGTEAVSAATISSGGQIGSTGKYIFYRSKTNNSWGTWSAYATAGITVNNNTAIEDYEFCISTSSSASVADSTILDRECVPIVKDGINGTSPWIADLDNEMDSVACGNDNKPIQSQDVKTTLALYHGISPEGFTINSTSGVKRNGTNLGLNNPVDGVTATLSGKVLTINYTTSATINGRDEFTITLENSSNSITRELTLTVNGVKGTAIYNLVPSVSSIYKDGNTNAYSPSTITCTYNKFDVAKNQSVGASGGTIKYYVDNESESDAHDYSSALTPGTTFTSKVTFLLYVGGGIVDKETIPVVTGGKNGSNSIRIDLDNEADIVSLDSDSKVRFSRTVIINAQLYEGASKITSGVTYTNSATGLAFGDVIPTLDFSNGTLTITYKFVVGNFVSAGQKTIVLKYNDKLYKAVFSLGTNDFDEIWQVMPTPSEVSFSLNSSTNTLTPSNQTLKCGYVKYTGSGTESVSAATMDNGRIVGSGGKLLVYRSKSGGAWGNWSDYSEDGILVNRNTTVTDYEFRILTCSESPIWSVRFYVPSGTLPTSSFGTPVVGDLGIKGNESVIYQYQQVGPSDYDFIALTGTSAPVINVGDCAKLNNPRYSSGTGAQYIDAWDGDVFRWNGTEWEHVYAETVIDSECVPVVKDGFNGDDAYYFDVTPNIMAWNADVDGKLESYTSIQGFARSFKGGEQIGTTNITSYDALPRGFELVKESGNGFRITPHQYYTSFKYNDVESVYDLCRINQYANGDIIYDSSMQSVGTISGTTSGSINVALNEGGTRTYTLGAEYVTTLTVPSLVTLTLQSDGISRTTSLTLIPNINGNDGAPGKMGRNIYYAGEFDEVSGTSFNATDFEAPYVKLGMDENDNPICYVFTGDNGSYTYPSNVSGYTPSAGWTKMTTEFKYLITEALFSNFAKLGAAVFNEDYMFSQYGTISSTDVKRITSAHTVDIYSSTYAYSETPVQLQSGYTIETYDNYQLATANPWTLQGQSYTARGTSNVYLLVSPPPTGSNSYNARYTIYGESTEYQKFNPDFVNGDIQLLSRTVNVSNYTSANTVSVGYLYLDETVNYTLLFEVQTGNTTTMGVYLIDTVNGGSVANWVLGGTDSRQTHPDGYDNVLDGKGYRKYNIRVFASESGKSLRLTGCSVASSSSFSPNVYVDWLNGKLFSRKGKFIDMESINGTFTNMTASGGTFTNIRADQGFFNGITVEGVINNQIVTISSKNDAMKYGKVTEHWSDADIGDKTVFTINPLKIDGFIILSYGCELQLPGAACVYTNGSNTQDVIFDGNLGLTLDDLRQCVGKKLILLPQTSDVGGHGFLCGGYYPEGSSSGKNELLVNEQATWQVDGGGRSSDDLYELTTTYHTESFDIYKHFYIQPQYYNNHYFYIFECKLGKYNSAECIYWTIQECARPLSTTTHVGPTNQ